MGNRERSDGGRGRTTAGRKRTRARRARPIHAAFLILGALLLPASVRAWNPLTAARDLLFSGAGERDQAQLLPGDSQRGHDVFRSKGCGSCHSLKGEPRRTGPVIGGRANGPLTAADITAQLWNHAPTMWRAMETSGFETAPFTTSEMSDAFAFFYYAGVLDPTGNAERGAALFDAMGCATCHATTATEPEKLGPGVQYWTAHTSPARLAQAMWNHAAGMGSRMRKVGIVWPQFEGTDIADIVAFAGQRNAIAQRQEFHMGDQTRGRKLFREKGCGDCHSREPEHGGAGPSLREMSGAAKTLTGMAGLMWNHYPQMQALIGETASQRFKLAGNDMGDLVAYLFTAGYFDAAGDAERGRAVFAAKRCVECHAAPVDDAPPVGELQHSASAVALAVALWNHGPAMIRQMRQRHIEWPELDRGEIVDLTAYLRGADD